MKLSEVEPWAIGGISTTVAAITACIAARVLKPNRDLDQEARDEKAEIARQAVSNDASGKWKAFADTLLAERGEREEAIDKLQRQVDDLKGAIDGLRDDLGRKNVQIAALTEQNKTLLGSAHRRHRAHRAAPGRAS